MNATYRARIALGCLLVGCGSSSHGDHPDATGPGGDAADAAIDGSVNGVFAIPLNTPTGADQGAFYLPAFLASGKSFLMDLDTGSTVTGIAGATCTTCMGMSPLYAPGAAAMSTGMTDSASYADGSGWQGSIYSDTVSLQFGTPDLTLAFVDITQQSTNPQFFAGNEYQGILGMGPAALLDPGTTAYFDKLTAAGVTPTMAFELCPTEGTMWLGGYDSSHVAGTMQYTPLLTTGINKDFYSVQMTDIQLGSTSLGVAAAAYAGPIVDTGTSLFYIPSKAETALIKDLNANAAFKTLFPAQTLTDPTNSNSPTAGCVNAKAGTTGAAIDTMLPKMAMKFAGMGGGTITLDVPALASYFYDAGGGQYCLAIYGGGDNGNATLGDTFMRAFVTVIDVANQRVGFALTNHCVAPISEVAHGPMRERGRGPNHVR
jgi:hypothetical protein